MTSLEQNFQNLRKVSSEIFAKIIWSKFHKNRPEIVAFRDPYRHTHAQTGLVWTKILSHTEMTEYKKHLTRPFLLKGGGLLKLASCGKCHFIIAKTILGKCLILPTFLPVVCVTCTLSGKNWFGTQLSVWIRKHT